jgi:excisionase family DNA binding protein
MNSEQITTQVQNDGQTAESFIPKEEVAKRLGKTVRCIDNWMARGLIPYFKIGRSVSFKWSDVESHLAQTCRVCRRTG